ncbi:MAG: beta-ketoacyl synthase, partial [Actinobacteria bacterium]|nr:beta-ketoacyl synthase [Actinomycetota bacterium]
AVVVASNLGNVEAVARVTRTVRDEGGSAVSVLDAPNASSNIVASTIALWFGFGAANLMVCSGAGAGFDGLELALVLLRAGRADRVVLVGVEPDDPVAAGLYAGSGRLRAGAACLVLERPDPRREAGLRLTLSDTHEANLTVGPGGDIDPARHWGDFYGAQDVIALALAAELAGGGKQVGVRSTGRPRRAVLSGAQG